MSKITLGLAIILILLFVTLGYYFLVKKTKDLKSGTYVNAKLTEVPIINESNLNYKILEKLKTVYPKLYTELLKLPELKGNTDKNRNGIEKVVQMGLLEKNKPCFELMMNEGIRAKRKYCTPLEALLWIAYDKTLDECNQFISSEFTISSLIENAWTDTSGSNNFLSKRWRSLDEVTDRLNSPQLIAIYMKFNFSYSYIPHEKEGVKSAEQVFKAKKGACYDHALFASYLLRKNGYDKAWGVSVQFKKIVNGYFGGHVANVYIDPRDKDYYSMDFMGNNYGGVSYGVYGPFSTLDEAANNICIVGSNGASDLKKYKCYNIDLLKGTYIKKSNYFIGD